MASDGERADSVPKVFQSMRKKSIPVKNRQTLLQKGVYGSQNKHIGMLEKSESYLDKMTDQKIQKAYK
jgi:hypothetical protein